MSRFGAPFARWDGKGVPRGVAGEEIELAARLVVVANYIEVEHDGGVDAAIALHRWVRGRGDRPGVVEGLASAAADILDGLEEHTWDAVVAAEPGDRGRLVEPSSTPCSGRSVISPISSPMVHRPFGTGRRSRRDSRDSAATSGA